MTLFSQEGLAFGGPGGGKRWALLIGINKYPFLGDVDLDGSVNDALGYQAVLQDRFDFPAGQVTVLLDEAATHDAILSAFDRLLARVHDGDQVVLSYSGHGRRIENPDSPETDRMDETFVPADSGSGFYPNRDIRDDEFLSRIVALTERGAYVTFICDCCHSSASLRDDFSASVRGIACDRRQQIQQQQIKAPVTLLPAGYVPPTAPRPRPGLGLRREHYVYVAACRDSELATEHIEQTDAGPLVHGALSFYLQRELAAARAGESMGAVIERAFASLSAECPEQHPRAEGALSEAPLFVADVDDDEPAEDHPDHGGTTVAVQKRLEKSVILGVGRLHGETVGSRYAIYPAGWPAGGPARLSPADFAAKAERPLLGVVEVTAVRATTVSAKILSEESPGAIVAGCLAVEQEHNMVLPPLRLELAVAPELAGERQALRTALAAVPAIQEVEDGSALLRLYALPARAAPSLGEGVEVAVPSAPVPQLGALAAPVWALVGRDGQLRAPPLAITGDPQPVCQLLAGLSTYQLVLGLDQRTSPLRGRLRATLSHRRPGERDWQPVSAEAGSLAMADEFDELSLSVTLSPPAGPLQGDSVPREGGRLSQLRGTWNGPPLTVGEADSLLHVAVLYLAASGEVSLWASHPDNPPRLPAGRTFLLGRHPGERHVLRIAPGFPPVGWEHKGERQPARPRVQDIVKIVVSSEPLQASMSVALRAGSLGDKSSPRLSALPARLLATALRGRKARRSTASLLGLSSPGGTPGAEAAREEWATLAIPFIVQRRP